MSNVIVHTQHGAFCAVCQSLLSMEEEDFGVCDACDGEGIGGDDDDDGPDTPQDHTLPELKAVLGDALKRRACPHRTCPCPSDCAETCQHAMKK